MRALPRGAASSTQDGQPGQSPAARQGKGQVDEQEQLAGGGEGCGQAAEQVGQPHDPHVVVAHMAYFMGQHGRQFVRV